MTAGFSSSNGPTCLPSSHHGRPFRRVLLSTATRPPWASSSRISQSTAPVAPRSSGPAGLYCCYVVLVSWTWGTHFSTSPETSLLTSPEIVLAPLHPSVPKRTLAFSPFFHDSATPPLFLALHFQAETARTKQSRAQSERKERERERKRLILPRDKETVVLPNSVIILRLLLLLLFFFNYIIVLICVCLF